MSDDSTHTDVTCVCVVTPSQVRVLDTPLAQEA